LLSIAGIWSSAFGLQGSGNLLLALVLTFSALAALALAVLVILRCAKYRGSAAFRNALMKRNPPGVLGTGTPVTIVVTDIEVSCISLVLR
jgi:hypothetical protein